MSSDINQIDPRIKLFIGQNVDFSALSREKLKEALALDDIKEIVVLPDIHSKPDNPFPTGIVTLTDNTIYPFAIGQEIGCGMRVLKTSLNVNELNPSMIDAIFNNIKKKLRDGSKHKPLFKKEDYLRILLDGYTWAQEKFILEEEKKGYVKSIKYQFEYPLEKEELMRVLPKDAFQAGYERIGALGGGNHFLELHAVDDILDVKSAEKIGIGKGQAIFIFHTGSGTFSKRLDNYYGIRFEKNRPDKDIRKVFRKALFHFADLDLSRFSQRRRLFFSKGFYGIPADSKEGKRYMKALGAAMNYSFANRSVISDFIRQAFHESLERSLSIELLSDTSHERIDREGLFWVHRNGATKVHQAADKLLLIPSSMGGKSFLCTPENGVSQTHNSINHGVGRIFDKAEAKEKFQTGDIYKALESRSIRFYKLGNEDIREQAPGAFKDITKVIDSLKTNQLVRPVATTAPIAILKG